ncbi:MAG: maleylpyruvate isomerase N-terminal domain-containing protein [Marmoricola sp.]
MGLTIELDPARAAFIDSVTAFVGTVAAVAEYDLFGPSLCWGWSRLDVVSHVIAGWHEMLGGMVSRVERAPTVDAATYWTAFAREYGDGDPVEVLGLQRRRTAAFARPGSAVAELRDVAAALTRGAGTMPDEPCLWQGHVFTAGDFLAVWAVEDAVHHLDLGLDRDPSPDALGLARRTVEALAGRPLPESWPDREAVLVGTGRLPVPEDAGDLRDRLPALG